MAEPRSLVLLTAAAALFAGAAAAQLQKGSRAPAFEFQKVWNGAPASFGELEGKLVILDFSQTWWGPCKAAVPHLNELYEKFRERGLLVIGVSDEPESKIEDIFMQKVGVKYPFVRCGGVNDTYGIKFFPSVYCISPEGEVLTVPDDRMPGEEFLEQQLAKVSLVPKMPADSRFDVLRQGWEKHDFKKVADYLDKMLAQENLDAELRTAYDAQKAELQKRSERQTARIAELGKGPDYASAETALTKIGKEWKGLPPGDQAAQELARFGKDAAIQRELTASKALAKLIEKTDTNKPAEKKKLADDLQKFCKKYAGTFACKHADELRSSLLMTKGG